MKVLYIGYYKEDSDWGRQTINNILALEEAGVDVVCRSINLSNSRTTCPMEIAHLENKDVSGAEYCIQHVFPDHMVGSHGVFKKNVGLLHQHFTRISYTSWQDKLSLMDEIWLSCPASQDTYKFIGDLKFRRLFSLDLDKYKMPYRPLNINGVDHTFKFYTIQSGFDPAGLGWLIAAFHAEFDPSEAVNLILQVEPNRTDPKASIDAVEKLSRDIKTNLHLHSSLESYKRDVIISSPEITQTNRFELHQYCDCYVSSNCSNSFPLNELDAYAFGNKLIVADKSVLGEADSEGDFGFMKTASIYQCVQSNSGMWKDVCNGKDFYLRICEKSLRAAMRNAFNSNQDKKATTKREKKIDALRRLEKFSMKNAGTTMKEALTNDI